MPMRGFFIDNGAFEKYRHRISARRMMTILAKASDSTMFPDDPAKGDNLFTPKTMAEAEYWKLLRDEIKSAAGRYTTNRENGARGGRPRKTESIPAETPKSAQSPTPADKRTAVNNLIGGITNKLGDKCPYKRVLVTRDFDLTRLDGDVGELMRMVYPTNRSDTLIRLSRWLRTNFVDKYIDSNWLSDQAKKFYATAGGIKK